MSPRIAQRRVERRIERRLAAVLAGLLLSSVLAGCGTSGRPALPEASVSSGSFFGSLSAPFRRMASSDIIVEDGPVLYGESPNDAGPIVLASTAPTPDYPSMHGGSVYQEDIVEHVPPAAAEVQPYLLDSGDQVRIFVYGQPNLSRTYPIDGAGFISMPLIGTVKARAMTTYQLQQNVAAELRVEYVRDPHVTVEVANYRPFFILGEVRTPGQYPFVNGMTVKTAAAIAGGFTERAYERSVQITRRITGGQETSELDVDEPVRPGDTIHVQERFF